MNKTKCDLSDEILLSKCTLWVSNLCRTGGRAWMLNVPVDFDNDPDMLFSELIARYETRLQKSEEATKLAGMEKHPNLKVT
jgi:hypothetical protein